MKYAMQIESPEQHARQQQAQKKYVLVSFALIFICTLCIAGFFCFKSYEEAKATFMVESRERLEKSAYDTVKAITEWQETLKNQTDRISSSELYRLFTKEAGQLDPAILDKLGQDEKIDVDDPETAQLLEQVPIIRNVLREFVKYSGFQDAKIVNGQGQILLSTSQTVQPITPPQLTAIKTAVEKLLPATSPLRTSGEKLVLDFVDPFHSPLSTERQSPVGAFLVTSQAETHLSRILGTEAKADSNFHLAILQLSDAGWEEVRPHGLFPLPATAEYVLDKASRGIIPFGLRASLREGKAYSLALQVPGTLWWVVAELPQKDVQEALSDKLMSIGSKGVLACLAVIFVLPLLWWVTVGRGQQASAKHFEELYHTIQRQKQLLDNINVSLEEGLFLVDEDGVIRLVNRAFGQIIHKDEAELQGTNLFDLFTGINLKRLTAGVQHVMKEGKTASFELDLRSPGVICIVRATLFPYTESESNVVTGVVGTMQDITDFRRRTILQQRQQMQTMNAFIRAVESVDPYLAGHSQVMKAICVLIGRQIGLSNKDNRTITMAAELSQVGKLSIPSNILHKQGALTPEELVQVRQAPENAYKILQDISFDLPVADAVYCMNERMDGSGYPRGLQGQQIGIHARVLAVANAFCAMISPRFYRQGMAPEDAVEALQGNTGFDPNVVQALHRTLQTAEGVRILQQHQLGSRTSTSG